MKNYTLFWGGHLSNWSTSPFTISNMYFNCGEQYMMYMKAITFKDYDIGLKILNTFDPKEQKALGRKVKNFDSTVWSDVSPYLMVLGLIEKFKQNPTHLKALLSAKNTIIVEASPYDRVWGIGYGIEKAMDNIDSWGENRLGKVLNKVLEEILKENHQNLEPIAQKV